MKGSPVTLFAIFALCLGGSNCEVTRETKDADENSRSLKLTNRRIGGLTHVGSFTSTVEDPDFYRNPRTLSEHAKMLAEQNNKALKDRGLQAGVSHTSLNDLHRSSQRSQANENTEKKSVQSAGDHNLRRRSLGSAQIASPGGRRKRCDGLRKIVQCKDGVAESVCKKQLVDRGVNVLSDMRRTMFFGICVGSEDEADFIGQISDVHSVEDDPPRTLSDVKGSEVVRELAANTQTIPYGISLVNATLFWERYGSKGEGIKICMIDTGVMTNHEDLKNADFDGSDDKNFVTPWDEDGNTHGTHITGIVVARDNKLGVVGVAPGASIFAVRVFDDTGVFSASDLVDALTACEEAGANIINMSLGGPLETTAERAFVSALSDAGILMVAASGNNAERGNGIDFPAGYEGVISVGAVDQNSHMAIFSNHNRFLDISGPGIDVLSTTSQNTSAYSEKSGTSMAVPHIAGVAALLWSQFPDRSAAEIRTAMFESARDFGACGWDRLFGHGAVDAVAAAEYLENGIIAPDLSGCVNVTIKLKTDEWGQETTYLIAPEEDWEDIMYRGGPYVNGQRKRYVDKIQLPPGCYNLTWIDSYGDGSNNAEFGVGEIALSYNRTDQVFSNNLEGFSQSFRFGECGEAITEAPSSLSTEPYEGVQICGDGVVDTDEECDDGNNVGGDGCDSRCRVETDSEVNPCLNGESVLRLQFLTDRWSRSENSLYLFDDNAPDDEWIWNVERWGFESDSIYEGEECLDPSACYRFFFFDLWGDGLIGGSLTLTLDGVVALEILPGDQGTPVADTTDTTTFWSASFGPCTELSGDNSN